LSNKLINSQSRSIENLFLFLIFCIFIIFASIYSLYTPTWEESDGWFHWLKIRNTAEGNFFLFQPERQQPLYYLITGGLLSFLDPDEISDNSLPRTKRNFYDDFNYFRHISPDEFKFGEENFQKGCVGVCTGLSEKFPFEGISLAVHSLRLFSIFCGVISLIFIYKITKLIFPNLKYLQLCVVGFVALIPQLVFINSILAPESLAITLSTIVIYYGINFFENPKNNKFVIVLGIFSGLALFTKVTTIFLPPVIILIFLLMYKRKFLSQKTLLKTLFVFIGLMLVSGGWWYITYSTQASSILSSLLDGPAEDSQFSLNLENLEESKFKNLLDLERHNFVYFESVWGNIGWKAIKTAPALMDSIKIISAISLIGIISLILTRTYKKSHYIKKDHLLILGMIVVTMLILILTVQYNSGRGTGRNLLSSVSGFAPLFMLGFYFIVSHKKIKFLLVIPLIILVIINLTLFVDMNEKFEHGLPRDPIYDANHDLRTEMWLGKGTLPQGSEPNIRLRNSFLENGEHDTILLMHPPNTGNSWWNFTMTLPNDPKYDLEFTYGFLSHVKDRKDPVEFTAYIDNKMILQDMKYFDGHVEKIRINLQEYSDDKVLISLSTDAKDYGYNKAWSFFKIKFIR